MRGELGIFPIPKAFILGKSDIRRLAPRSLGALLFWIPEPVQGVKLGIFSSPRACRGKEPGFFLCSQAYIEVFTTPTAHLGDRQLRVSIVDADRSGVVAHKISHRAKSTQGRETVFQTFGEKSSSFRSSCNLKGSLEGGGELEPWLMFR